jgi:hypothetical protein
MMTCEIDKLRERMMSRVSARSQHAWCKQPFTQRIGSEAMECARCRLYESEHALLEAAAELARLSAANDLLVVEVQKNGPMALDLMVARSERDQLRRDLWDIAGSVVAACDSGNENIARMACMEGSPLVGESRAVIDAHGLGPDDSKCEHGINEVDCLPCSASRDEWRSHQRILHEETKQL